jgi:hypothetical protein
VMLLPLAALGGPVRAPAATVHLVRPGSHPHPCTPYAGCDVITLPTSSGTGAP